MTACQAPSIPEGFTVEIVSEVPRVMRESKYAWLYRRVAKLKPPREKLKVGVPSERELESIQTCVRHMTIPAIAQLAAKGYRVRTKKQTTDKGLYLYLWLEEDKRR